MFRSAENSRKKQGKARLVQFSCGILLWKRTIFATRQARDKHEDSWRRKKGPGGFSAPRHAGRTHHQTTALPPCYYRHSLLHPHQWRSRGSQPRQWRSPGSPSRRRTSRSRPAETRLLSFPYSCPEPVCGEMIGFSIKWRKRRVFPHHRSPSLALPPAISAGGGRCCASHATDSKRIVVHHHRLRIMLLGKCAYSVTDTLTTSLVDLAGREHRGCV